MKGLKDEIRKLVGYIGITNPRTNGPWVDTNKVTDQLLQTIKDRIKERVSELKQTPRQAEERAKALTLADLELAEEAIRFHARNEVLNLVSTILDEELKS